MVFMDIGVGYEPLEKKEPEDGRRMILEPDSTGKKGWCDVLGLVNKLFGIRNAFDDTTTIIAYDLSERNMKLIAGFPADKVTKEECGNYILKCLSERFYLTSLKVSGVREISSKEFCDIADKVRENGALMLHGFFSSEMKLSYFDNNCFKVREEIVGNNPEENGKSREQRIKEIMGDRSLVEELDRIYSEQNPKKFMGHPVHYKITCSSLDIAKSIVDVLVPALYENGRILSKRVSYFTQITENCYEDPDIDCLFENCRNAVLVIDMTGREPEWGNFASVYENVTDYLTEQIEKNHLNTLCIFVENSRDHGFSRLLLGKAQEHIDIIDIKEGTGNREQAAAFLRSLAVKELCNFEDEDIEECLPDKGCFTTDEIYGIYRKWFKNSLKNKVYRSYRECEISRVEIQNRKSNAYTEIKSMVGLKEIKKLADQIITEAKVNRVRSQAGIKTEATAKHMIFTGNPGTAKTTVARLLAEILRDEGILETGRFVECGRADLVGRFVGWTAKQVQMKFKDAAGGVLFIDEAYSLVDDSNSFGDEAINTIVQEMENCRKNVIVIFAGYPEKMKAFMEKNEGLRSRIAFHLDFNDYNADELVQILKLQADKLGYTLAKGVNTRCRRIFTEACRQSNFGNGRYVRNVLEKALLHQAMRIADECNKAKLDEKKLKLIRTLKAEDFDDAMMGLNTELNKAKVVGF